MVQLVLTIIGRDRPGLVSALSDTVAAGGGNWLNARMATLAGHFAGVLLIQVPGDRAEALVAGLRRLESQGLHLVIEPSADANDRPQARTVRLALIGQDRPGIVREISRALAQAGVSIVELETAQVSGSFSGETMFDARAVLHLPESVDPETLREALEALADELMVDLSLEEGTAAGS